MHFAMERCQESESDLISIATSDEVAAANDAEDENEGNETVENESDEKREMAPITEQEEDQCVIPIPPPPPPIYSSFRDVNMNFTREDVNQIKRELNFAISRLTSEVVASYEQARAMQKHVPLSLNQIFVDFTQNQEIKKTFFIKEIITCVERFLNKLTPKERFMASIMTFKTSMKLSSYCTRYKPPRSTRSTELL